MIRTPHIILISITASLGIFSLWLYRIYYTSPLLGELTVVNGGSALTTVVLFISAITSPAAVLTVGIVGALFAVYEHHIRLWWLFVGLSATSITVASLLKGVIKLDRPEYSIIQLSSYGFPSTHATLATVIFITVSWFVYYWQHELRQYITLAVTAGWLIICASRILLGVHNVSDVLAGIMLGATIGSLAVFAGPKLFSYFNIHTITSDPS